MQFVKTSDLKPGMRLAKPIYNKMGVLLYERNTKLTLQGINSVENFGLIGIYILEPAEPVPPITQDELEFEQFQTVYMFKLKDIMDKLQKDSTPASIQDITENIYSHYGTLDRKLHFTQNLRSSADFVYKHSLSVAILTAMITNALHFDKEQSLSLISAALLYDFGYLYVPHTILGKGEDLEEKDLEVIQFNREKGSDLIRLHLLDLGLSNLSFEIIQRLIFQQKQDANTAKLHPELKTYLEIIRVASKFDQMTAMNLERPPISELAGITYLLDHPEIYDAKIVNVLADCIHILPTGACLDLANGEKALVIQDNPYDFLHPMILSFSDNKPHDLSDPKEAEKYQILDIMKTMDNRIKLDEEARKQFVADEQIKQSVQHFREKKMLLAQRRQQRASSSKTSKR